VKDAGLGMTQILRELIYFALKIAKKRPRMKNIYMVEQEDKEELNHFMQCRLGDSCDRCKRFIK
jgi:hypothetical protein